jgi:hypothetical protein
MQKNLNSFIGLILLAWLFVILGSAAEAKNYQKENSNESSGSPPLSREDAVREAVFKYQIERMTSALQQKDVVFFLSVDEEANPSDALLTRFAGRRPPVKKASESFSKEYEGIYDKETGKKGILFRITSIKWVSETEAEVEGGHYTGPLAASGHVYKMRFENGKWVVTDDDMKWISQVVIAA